jgi:acyl transferase domain-containing protein
MSSPSGRCHTFDSSADGYLRGEGCGAVVLKRMSDATRDGDLMYGVVRGVGVAQDGESASLTAPNGLAQEKLLRFTLADAGLESRDVDYLEAHGTGTPLGDPIEINAAVNVLCEGREADRPLLVGSVKANIGHLEAAAGMAGLIKALLVLQHEQAPANLKLKTLNPKIAEVVEGRSIRFPVALEPLHTLHGDSSRLKVAGVSSFGFSGTIAHAIVSQPPAAQARPLASVRATMSSEGETVVSREGVVWMFTGQGSQYEGMGRGLYEAEAVFREAMDRCETAHQGETGESLLAVMFPVEAQVVSGGKGEAEAGTKLDETRYAQAALLALEWSLSELWRSKGVEPSLVVGHSVGEIAAACVAGAMSMEDAMKVVAARGRLMQALDPMGGVMVAVRCSEAEARAAMSSLGTVDPL